MITVRLARIEDKTQIKRYCEEHHFIFPNADSLYLAEDANNTIVGIGGLEIVVKIEPFIADNPIIANRLYEELHKILVHAETKRVECFTPNDKMPQLKKLYAKLGFIFAEQTNRFIKHIK